MTLLSINQIPRGSEYDGSVEISTKGFGSYCIAVYTKNTRRYYELTGRYTGKSIYSTSIKDDRNEAIRHVKSIANSRVARFRKDDL